jgi:ribonuclease HII
MIICGGDEAGRGALLGPLVVSIVAAKKDTEKRFADIGVRDSKLLTPLRREALYDSIHKAADEVLVELIPPSEINKAMQSGISLNELEAVYFSRLLDRLSVKPSVLYLDSPDVIAEKFGVRVNIYSTKPTKVMGVKNASQKGIKYTMIVAEHKADSKYPVVSAASIIAKVTRDREIAKLSDELGVDIGSGYPSDASTVNAVKENIRNADFKKHIREYWTTINTIRQTRILSFSDDEEIE